MSNQNKIIKDIEIEELVNELPEAVTYLMDKGIKCLSCGEPVWGSLESAAREKGFNDFALEEFVNDLNSLPQKN